MVGMLTIGDGFALLAAAIAIGLGALATAYAQGKIGSSGMALLAERENARAIVIILLAIPETMVILGFVIAILILTYSGGL